MSFEPMQLQSFSCLWPPECCCNWKNRAGSQRIPQRDTLISFPRFFWPWREVGGYPIPLGAFMAQMYVCAVVVCSFYFCETIQELKATLKFKKKKRKLQSMCWVLISSFCILHQQQTTTTTTGCCLVTQLIPLCCLPSPLEGTVALFPIFEL